MIKVKQFTFNPVEENTFILISESNECVIVDPGFYTIDEKETFMSFLQKEDLKPTMLINTHCHFDHTFGIREIQDKFALPLHIHLLEQPVLDQMAIVCKMYGFEIQEPTSDIIYISEKESLNFADSEFRILFTPGHSPGSICFYNEIQGFIIAGDVLFYGSIGRTDLPGGDHEMLLRSIQEELLVLPDNVVVYPGHGPTTTIGQEKMHNPFL